ncbi:hypothetical protein Gpo141_00007079 [Globisporangium polare]
MTRMLLLLVVLILLLQTVEARSKPKRGSSSKSSSGSGSSGSGSAGGVNLWVDLLMACFVIFVVLAPSFFFRVNDTAASSRQRAPSSSSARLPRRPRVLSTRKER